MRKLQLVFIGFSLYFIQAEITAQITPQEAVVQMQKGINLGNTMEPPQEGQWGNPAAQEYYFDMDTAEGFQCIRIPVRWDEHTLGVSPYTINASWMQRVEQIVDWGLSRGLFIVINAHHEEWIKSNYGSADTLARFDSIWSQISVRFRNKSERLLFEIINEPYGLTRAQNDDLHLRVLSIIRKTNPTRIVIFQGHNWGGSDELIQAAIPNDPYLIGSFHSYDPYLFGLEGQGTWGTPSDIATLTSKFTSVKNWSTAHNIPVLLGEFGAVKTADYNSRMKHYRTYVELAQQNGFVACAWDDGGEFRIMEREAHGWNEIKDVLLHTTVASPKNPRLTIFQDTIIQLTWSNPVTDYQHIFIERKTSTSQFTRVATLDGNINLYQDKGLLRNKEYYYRVIAQTATGEDVYAQPLKILLPPYTAKVRSFYLGCPFAIPGIIEAEDFDIGGEGLTYHDMDQDNIAGAYRPGEGVDIYSVNGTAYHVGNALPGEWIEYTVNVSQAAAYYLDIYQTAVPEGGTFKIKIGSVETDVITTIPSVNWLTTKRLTTSVALSAGVQIMRFSILSNPWFNTDKFVLCPVTATASNDTIFDTAATNIIVMDTNIPAHKGRYTWTVSDNPNITGQSDSPLIGQALGTPIIQTLHNQSAEPQLITYTITPWTTDSQDNLKFAGVSFNVEIWVKPAGVTSVFNNIAAEKEPFTLFQGPNHELVVDFSTEQPISWISIYNSNGAQVRIIQKPEKHIVISTSDLLPGLYIISTLLDQERFSKKILLY